MTVSSSVCLPCRLRLLSRLYQPGSTRAVRGAARPRTLREFTTTPWTRQDQHIKATSGPSDVSSQIPAVSWNEYRINPDSVAVGQRVEDTLEEHESVRDWGHHRMTARTAHDADDNELEFETEAEEPPDEGHALSAGEQFIIAKERSAIGNIGVQPNSETVARAARQAFGDHLPEGALDEQQYKIYERMYGAPLREPLEEEEELEEERNVLYREGADGQLEEVGPPELDVDLPEEETPIEVEGATSPQKLSFKRSFHDDDVQRDIAAAIAESQALGRAQMTVRSPDDLTAHDAEEQVEEAELEDEDQIQDLEIETPHNIRSHHFTAANRFGTVPSTLPLPEANLTKPVELLLSNVSNKHLDEAASRIFEGPGLPYSPSTPRSSRTLPQKVIPLNAAHTKMSDIEADVYMVAVMPQTYAAVMSTLVETRKRLGATWLENLLRQEGGPRILDAGAGGAGVIAWREVLKAEWKRMHDLPDLSPSVTRATSDVRPHSIPPTPIGKSTVLTGSDSLRTRASALLSDTTFLPRLPDYYHARLPEEESQRKQYDIIIAPHSLWNIKDPIERKHKLANLWSLLEPKGGVLILIEKGIPRGFEVIGDARDYIIRSLFSRKEGDPELDEDTDPTFTPDPSQADASEVDLSGQSRVTRRAPGHVVAPCPHEFKCPLYLVPGASRQRKDYCRFRQRYIRPPYLQRMLQAKDANHDDVEFSYISIQKGFTLADRNAVTLAKFPTLITKNNTAKTFETLTGEAANDRAFEGYDLPDTDLPPTFNPFAVNPPPPKLLNPLPRLILPALKRHGHIHLDVCTPAGTFDRWTVPKSYGKQPYRDARKSSWGDLWALGASIAHPRRVRLGVLAMERGIGTGRGAEAFKELGIKGARGREKKPRRGEFSEEGEQEEAGKEEALQSGGPVQDVKGRRVKGGRFGKAKVDGEEAEIEEEKKRARIQKRIAEKSKGRLKARTRRREETRALFEGGSKGGE